MRKNNRSCAFFAPPNKLELNRNKQKKYKKRANFILCLRYFADLETKCQVYHICVGKKAQF